MLKRKSALKSNDRISQVMSDFMGRPFKWVMIIVATIMVLLPLYWLFTSSIKFETDYLASPPVFMPGRVTFTNYLRIFIKDGVNSGMYNSLIIAVIATVICVLFGSMAAYTLAKGEISRRTRHIFGFWFLIQKMYPAVATAIPIYLVMRNLGLMDTKLSLIIMNISFNLPLVIWLMLGFFEEIPKEIEESGVLDGCNMWQRYRYLVMPITKPGLIAAAILTFVAVWNEFLFAAILSISRSKTLPVIIAGFITDRGLEWGPMAAMGVVLIIPVIIVVLLLQKDFVKGLAMGAVKE